MKTFAVTSMKGGVGKSATAVSLAWLSASEGARTLLWDLDPQGAASYALRIEAAVAGGGRELLRRRDALEAAIKESDHRGLDLLPADFSYRKLDLQLEERGESVLARLLEPLSARYDHVFVDCPPGLSLLVERVLVAADVCLVPVVPTVLSLRTLSRLLKHLKGRRGEGLAILYFFCMVDARRGLHRRVREWARGEGLGFLDAEIPYSSLVEQVAVRRSPLGAWAPASAPARAYGELWREIRERLASGAAARPSKAVRAGLRGFQAGEAREGPARSAEDGAVGGPLEIEFKLRVEGEADFEKLARAALGERRAQWSTARQVNHFFDTAAGDLRRAGCALRLREEEGRSVLTAKGPEQDGASGGALSRRAEAEAEIDAAAAAEVLAGRASPLAVLAAQLGVPAPRLVGRMVAVVGERRLERLGSFENERRRLGPIALEADGERTTLLLEMDRTRFPGGRVDHEVEAEVASADAEVAARVLRDLFARAELPWRTSTSKAQRFHEALERLR